MVEQQWVEQWVAEVTTTDTWAQVVARAWADAAFEARLVADPSAVLREAGLAVPAGLAVWVEAPGVPEAPMPGARLVLPPKPPADDFTEEPLGGTEGLLTTPPSWQTQSKYPYSNICV